MIHPRQSHYRKFVPVGIIPSHQTLSFSSTTLDKKKELSSRSEARRTLFHVWYHARWRAISAGQKSRRVADRTCAALIACDRTWYHTWNSVLLAANLEDGSFFFVQGSTTVSPDPAVSSHSCRRRKGRSFIRESSILSHYVWHENIRYFRRKLWEESKKCLKRSGQLRRKEAKWSRKQRLKGRGNEEGRQHFASRQSMKAW